MKISGLFITFILFLYGNLFTQVPDTLWSKIHSISPQGDIDEGRYVRQTLDGGYIITGSCIPNGLLSHIDLLILKTDDSGNILWTKTYLERSYGNCVAQTSDGGYIMVGWIFPDEQDIQSDVLLIKTDSSGDTIWTKIIGEEDYEAGFCVRQTADGYVIVGQTKPKGSPYDALFIKTDLSGEVIWIKKFGGEWSDAGFSVEVSHDGFFITGTTNGNWWVHAGDMWAFKTDSNGNLLWEKIYDVRLSDFAFNGIQTSDDSYVVTGMTSTGFGGDLWLAKLGWIPTSIENNRSSISEFVLHQNYPNPFNPSTTIAFDLPKTSKVTLKIFNIIGEEVTTLVSDRLSAGSYTYKWYQPVGMASDVYFYRLDTDQYVQTRKMILMR